MSSFLSRRRWLAGVLAIAVSAPFVAVIASGAGDGASAAPAPVIKHKLLLLDESRPQVLYVDETNPANNWSFPLKGTHGWGFQLVGNNRLLVSLKDFGGFREYDLATRKTVVNVVNKSRYGQVSCAVRLPDGGTLISSPRGRDSQFVRFAKADAKGQCKEIAKWKLPFGGVRQIRLTKRGTFLAADGGNSVYECSIADAGGAGKILRKRSVPGAKQVYQVSELPNGNLLLGGGYAGFMAELGWEGDILRRWGNGNPKSTGAGYYYMSQFHVLKNGNIVSATWTGHGANDSRKHQQVVEFAPDGTVVWKWHDPKAAGSIHGVYVMDELDPQKLFDDTTGATK